MTFNDIFLIGCLAVMFVLMVLVFITTPGYMRNTPGVGKEEQK
jgi:hypothetical protein